MSEFTKDPSSTQRPTFLTVLCILSAIAGLWGVYGGIQSSFTDKPQRDFEEARTQVEDAMEQVGQSSGLVANMLESSMDLAERSLEHAEALGFLAIGTSLLGLLGVWLMWNLRRMGFGIYVLASLIGLFAPFGFLGFSLVSVIALGLMGLVTLLFIILYATNLKHMR